MSGGKEGERKREGGETQLAGELCYNYKVEHLLKISVDLTQRQQTQLSIPMLGQKWSTDY